MHFPIHVVNISIVIIIICLLILQFFSLKKKSLERFSMTFFIPSGSPGIAVVSV